MLEVILIAKVMQEENLIVEPKITLEVEVVNFYKKTFFTDRMSFLIE